VTAKAFHRPFHRSKTASIAYSVGTSIAPSIAFDRASIGLLLSPHTPRSDRSALARAFHPASDLRSAIAALGSKPSRKDHRMTDDGKPSRDLTRLEPEAIVRQLRIIRYSSQASRIGRRVPGIRTVARHAGLSFRTVYTIVQTGRLTPGQALALARALEAVQDWPYELPRPPPAGPRGL
jgi:hypothetical protein